MLNAFVFYLLLITPQKSSKAYELAFLFSPRGKIPALEGHSPEDKQCSELLMSLQGLQSLSALEVPA